MNSKNYAKIFYISVFLILSIFQIIPDLLIANDHKTNEKHYKRYKDIKEYDDYDNHNRRRVKKDDDGNETTGQITAWFLVAANLTVAFSILLKGAGRFLRLDPQTKSFKVIWVKLFVWGVQTKRIRPR